jgi:hypothetical protein
VGESGTPPTSTTATGTTAAGTTNPGLTPDWTATSGIRGWYYDLPETGAKVLANPQLQPDDTLLFYSATVPTVTVGSSDGSNSAATETCTPTVAAHGAQSVMNYFGLFTGNATADIVTVDNVQYNGSGDGVANRVSLGDAVAGLPLNGNGMASPTNGATTLTPQTTLPRNVGWRFSR